MLLLVALELLLLLLHGLEHLLLRHRHPGGRHVRHVTTCRHHPALSVGVGLLGSRRGAGLHGSLTLHGFHRPHLHVLHALQRRERGGAGGGGGALDQLGWGQEGGSAVLHLPLEAHLEALGPGLRHGPSASAAATAAATVRALEVQHVRRFRRHLGHRALTDDDAGGGVRPEGGGGGGDPVPMVVRMGMRMGVARVEGQARHHGNRPGAVLLGRHTHAAALGLQVLRRLGLPLQGGSVRGVGVGVGAGEVVAVVGHLPPALSGRGQLVAGLLEGRGQQVLPLAQRYGRADVTR